MATISTTRLAALVLAAFVSQACGEDEGGGGGGSKDDAKKAADKKKKEDAAKKKKKKGKQPEPVSYILGLEQKMKAFVDKEGNPLVKRPVLTLRDFSATDNRDPFRSYVLPQVAEDDPATTTGPVLPTGPVMAPTAECKKAELIATNFSIEDLELVGIVRRGQKRFALFRDTRQVGHMVDKGKCLGREKGKIIEIDDALVCYEVLPEQPVDATAVSVPVKKCVSLYPEEITNSGGEELDLSARPDILAPSEPPPPTPGPPPATAPGPVPTGPP